MNKVNGTQASFAPIREDGSRIAICYGLKKLSKDLYEWFEVYLPKKQMPQLTFDVVKQAILADINARTTERIISGFDYTVKHGGQAGTQVKVWLSKENQSDFHAMHQQADDLTFPLRYKIGELEDGTPVYEEFADAGEMHAICVATTNHVLACQQAGWAEKDAIDWAPYEALFQDETPAPEVEE
jgi:hypothetical protein